MKKTFGDMDWQRSKMGSIDNNIHNVEQVKNLLNDTGCGFCLAKFKQVTMHLGTGLTHSCHHPSPHKIDPIAVQSNPNELFNTPILKKARAEMLNGQRPKECDYCWRVEDNGNNSDRYYKSLESWALPDHDTITEYSGNEDIYPSYLEVDFSNVCNLKCTYCGPEFSSKWVEELKQQGPVKVLAGTKDEQWVQGYQKLDTLNYKNREVNPYVEAFWKWFPDALPYLKHYRITGGEPLMSKETFRSMDWLIENPNPDMEFSINSNFSVPDKLWDKFIEKLDVLRTNNRVKKITVYTSIEGWGKRAEYARTGLKFDLLKKRVEQLMEMGNVRCTIMAAYNIFSVTSMKDMLEWIHELKVKYNPNNSIAHFETETGFNMIPSGYTHRRIENPDHATVMGVDIPYLRHPSFLDAQYIDAELTENYMIPALNFMASRAEVSVWGNHQGFEIYEIEKFKRIVTHRIYFDPKHKDNNGNQEIIDRNRAKFYDFVNTMDERRGTNFLDTFPEMADFYELCRASKEKWINDK